MSALRSDIHQEQLFRKLSICAVSASIVIAWLVAAAARLHWDLSGFAAVGIAASFPLLIGAILYRSPGSERLATSFTIFGLSPISGFACGAISIVSTRTPMPLADQLLSNADAAVGLSAPRFITIIASSSPSIIDVLRHAYQFSATLMIASMIILPLLGQARKAWRFSAQIHITLLLSALIAFAFPAYGAFSVLGPDQVATLPHGAGRYFWPQLTAFRNAVDPVISLQALGGVVAFPSFHTITALLIAEAWSDVKYANKIVCVFSSVVIVSTVPMGGHYFVDVIAGGLLWLSSSMFLDLLATRSARGIRHNPNLGFAEGLLSRLARTAPRSAMTVKPKCEAVRRLA